MRAALDAAGKFEGHRYGLPGGPKFARLLAPELSDHEEVRFVFVDRDATRRALVITDQAIYQLRRKRASDGERRAIRAHAVGDAGVASSRFHTSTFFDLIVEDRRGTEQIDFRIGQFTPSGFEFQDHQRMEDIERRSSRILDLIADVVAASKEG